MHARTHACMYLRTCMCVHVYRARISGLASPTSFLPLNSRHHPTCTHIPAIDEDSESCLDVARLAKEITLNECLADGFGLRKLDGITGRIHNLPVPSRADHLRLNECHGQHCLQSADSMRVSFRTTLQCENLGTNRIESGFYFGARPSHQVRCEKNKG